MRIRTLLKPGVAACLGAQVLAPASGVGISVKLRRRVIEINRFLLAHHGKTVRFHIRKSTKRQAAVVTLGLILIGAGAAHSKPRAKPSKAAKPSARKVIKKVTKAAEVPRLGLYTGIWVGTQSEFGRAEPDLTLLPGNRYKQLDKVGRLKYFPAERRIEWLDGPMPAQWVGFFKPKGTDGAAHDTIVIRDKKDVDAGNMGDLRWYNAR